MILSDQDIRELCLQGLVDPFDEELINPASLDVRLGTRLLIEAAQSPELVPYTMEEPYLLVPGQFVLAETLEIFNLPDSICANFALKSSRAREGLSHALAGFADPGWHGSRLTLELHNIRQLHPVSIWPGMKIGQAIFHKLTQPPLKSYAVTGRYNNDLKVMGSKG
jgi:dCTP deaminase